MLALQTCKFWRILAIFSGALVACYLISSGPETFFLVKVYTTEEKCKEDGFKEPHIFFVETSGSPVLNSRQACSVESAARHNPSTEVYVLMMSNATDNGHNLTKALSSLQNVNILSIDAGVFLQDSPLFMWYNQGKWKNSKWKVSHMSDALRFFLVWNYGGSYLDMDTVTLRPFEHLKNAAISEDWRAVACGILLNFDKKHELMRRCLSDIIEHYNPNKFNANGPLLFTRNIMQLCQANSVTQISQAKCGINVLAPEAAYPIPYRKWKNYFVAGSTEDVAAAYNSSYLIHVWNTFSKGYKLQLGSGSLYELAIQQHCPIVYDFAKAVGYV